MGKSNVPLIVLLILLLISGFIAFKFYSDVQILFKEKNDLKEVNSQLSSEIEKLKEENQNLMGEVEEKDQRWRNVQAELSRLERENNSLQARYERIKREREELERKLEEASRVTPPQRPEVPQAIPPYWEDVVREKAELKASLDEMNKELLDAKSKINELDKQNKELSIKIDQLTQDKERLEKDLEFKERTLQVMSKDLVNERERRQNIAEELAKLREENTQLKQDIILANEEKARLQENLKAALQKREELEVRVSQIERVLKEKSLLFDQLKDELVRALKGEPEEEEEAEAVELPPIVVKPQAQVEETTQPISPGVTSVRKLTGSILAVNKRENFVIIDLGEDMGVTPGAQFDVYRDNKPIGIIEVIETRKEISAADIKSVEAGNSIKEGDPVISK